jgi:hypothetical protein
MRGHRFQVFARAAACAVLFSSLFAAQQASAAESNRKSAAEKHRHAVALVAEALHREIYGAEQERGKLLAEASAAAENYEPARWHQGFVREHKRWVKFDAVPQMQADYRVLAAYRTQRDKASDTVAGQLELAEWCQSRGLADQARAHLTRVLELEPDHAQARRLLGHRRVGESWVTPQEVEASLAEAKQLQEALARWSPKLKRLLARLESPNRRARELAADELKSIDDAAAIPVIEAVLSERSEQTAGYAVDSLANMTNPAASVSLARHAVFAPWDSVRRGAAQRLKDKPLEQYVPVLLGAMRSPVQARRALYRSPDGQLNYRYAVYREGRDRNELTVFESAYVRLPRAGGDRAETLGRAVVDAAGRNMARDATVAAENMATVELNARIARTLGESTGQSLSADPAAWWKWWDDHNEVFVALEKPTSIRFERETVRIEDSAPPSIGISQETSSDEDSERKDCLAAGTLVWTETGPAAIENISIGDRVLAQDPQTGELAYKPVLRTTIRPVGRLTRIHLLGDESIATSGGHLFWCAGEGWVRSRDVKSGMLLHTVDGARHVSFVERASEEPTYNLVVADFNTYFVGQSRVLSHDNTASRPTDNKVPGLAEK